MNIKRRLTLMKYSRFIIWTFEIILWISYIANIVNIYNFFAINIEGSIVNIGLGVLLFFLIFIIPTLFRNIEDEYCILTKSRIVGLIDKELDEIMESELNKRGIEVKLEIIDKYEFYESAHSNMKECHRVYIREIEIFRKYSRSRIDGGNYRVQISYKRKNYVSWEVLSCIYFEVKKIKNELNEDSAKKSNHERQVKKEKKEEAQLTLDYYLFSKKEER